MEVNCSKKLVLNGAQRRYIQPLIWRLETKSVIMRTVLYDSGVTKHRYFRPHVDEPEPISHGFKNYPPEGYAVYWRLLKYIF